jgi:hypothetical protein
LAVPLNVFKEQSMPQAADDSLARLVANHPNIWSKDAVAMSHVPRGWYAIVDGLLSDIETELGDYIGVFQVEQVKSKYAELRLYYSLNGRTKLNIDISAPGQHTRFRERAGSELDERLDVLIHAAERQCAQTCELCGARGQLCDRGGWLLTLCEAEACRQKAVVVRMKY